MLHYYFWNVIRNAKRPNNFEKKVICNTNFVSKQRDAKIIPLELRNLREKLNQMGYQINFVLLAKKL